MALKTSYPREVIDEEDEFFHVVDSVLVGTEMEGEHLAISKMITKIKTKGKYTYLGLSFSDIGSVDAMIKVLTLIHSELSLRLQKELESETFFEKSDLESLH